MRQTVWLLASVAGCKKIMNQEGCTCDTKRPQIQKCDNMETLTNRIVLSPNDISFG